MGITERRIRQKEELRGAILTAAWQIVEAEGWAALSMRRIADAIEYSAPVVYTHFENKDAILHEFTKDGFSKLADALQAAKDKEATPDNQLRAIAHAYREYAFSHREYYQLMFGLGIPTCDVVNAVAETKKVSNVLLGTVEAVMKSGNNPDGDVFLKYHTFWSILHGMVSIQMVASSAAAPNDMQCAILKDAIDGFVKALTL